MSSNAVSGSTKGGAVSARLALTTGDLAHGRR